MIAASLATNPLAPIPLIRVAFYLISRTPAHKYFERNGKYGLYELLELSRAPREIPNIPPGLPKISTVSLIQISNGLVNGRKMRFKVEHKKPIFDPGNPNEVWSADFKSKSPRLK